MKVLVSDTSVLIDLERAGVISATMSLPFEFVVPDALFEQELRPWNGERLVSLGLRIEPLGDREVTYASAARRACPRLSIIDAFALALAELRDWTLLVGDAALREEAKARSLACHGTLWVFDQLEAAQNSSGGMLHEALSKLRDHPRCRIPAGEVRARLSRYKSATELLPFDLKL